MVDVRDRSRQTALLGRTRMAVVHATDARVPVAPETIPPASSGSDELLRRIVHAASEGMVIHADGVITEANQGFADLFGFADRHDAIGRRILDFVAPEALADLTAGVPADGSPIECRCRRIDGTRVLVESTAAEITYRGSPARVVTATDVTRQRRDELQLPTGETRTLSPWTHRSRAAPRRRSRPPPPPRRPSASGA